MGELPRGVVVKPLLPHRDERGVFTEVFRVEWDLIPEIAQWNVVRSQARVLRGVHGHWRHRDYLTCIAGRMQVGLRDLRRDSPTRGLAAIVELDAEQPGAIVIPTGVAHGFYYPEPAIHAYAVTETWDPEDELGCRFDDPQLGLRWPDSSPLLSSRDQSLGSMADLERELHRRMSGRSR